jgi:hypothetical protein
MHRESLFVGGAECGQTCDLVGGFIPRSSAAAIESLRRYQNYPNAKNPAGHRVQVTSQQICATPGFGLRLRLEP